MRAILLGLAASFFFAFTFVLNRSMDLSGGHWTFSASLRFFFMVPLLLAVVAARGKVRPTFAHLAENLRAYLVWSTVGFGLFYAPLSFAAAYGEGWLVAGTWQVTIICGPLLVPFLLPFPQSRESFAQRLRYIPFRGMRWSALILVGVVLMQWEHASSISVKQALLCALPVVFAAFMYPLGNRRMMSVCGDDVDAFQRALAMTVASLPFFALVGMYGFFTHGAPSWGQAGQSLVVAVSSGVFATTLFFAATNLVRRDFSRLAAVEATQAGEILFALVGEILLLSEPLPAFMSLCGMALVVAGMILHSLRPAH